MEYVVTGASVFVLWGISAAVAGLIANDRERNPWAFAAITFFFLGPLGVGLAILAPHGAVERARLISARAAAQAAESAEPETAGSDAPADGVQSAAAVEEPVVEVVEAVEVAEAAEESVAEVEVAAVEVAAVEPEPVVVQPEAAEPKAAVGPEPKAVEDKPAASPKPAAKPAAEAKRELRTIACSKCKTKNAVPIDARRMRCRKCREISAVAA